ncbi:unnamed protein product [Callosobruchus maculatus]|uniref:LITAF domain-containing protein n=1 Tax=Callosobruchus maculatus TaxID=64391 RepID=A0A653BZ42_CALMS|nr:unnamed protein product [Callosobruchus maculatus]
MAHTPRSIFQRCHKHTGMRQDANTTQSKINTCQSTIGHILDDLVERVLLPSTSRSSSLSEHSQCPVCFPIKPVTTKDAQGDEESKVASSTVRSLLGEMLDFTLRVRSSIIVQSDELNTISQIFCMPGTSENTVYFEEIRPSRLQVCRSLGTPSSTTDDLRAKQVQIRRSHSTILPSYSTVLALGPPPKIRVCGSSGSFIPRVPPPSYAEVEGIWEEPASIISSESAIFGTSPMYIICPRCRTIVVTHVERARSQMTHVMALILCVFMCWPCAVLPYCMKSCNYTHHTCPNCRYYFGTYRPFN